jgi:RNA polymerase sigma factor (sigma-70 family)
MTNEPLSDRLLLESWRAGDQRAGEALLGRHFTPLLRFVRNKVGSDADDIVQRTFLACVENCQRIRGEATFRTYLFTVARHELYRFFRQRAARAALYRDLDVATLLDPGSSVVEEIATAERAVALDAALRRLPSRDQTLLALCYSEELDSRALAELYGIKPSSVRARLHRARSEIKRQLRDAELEAGRRPDARSALERDHAVGVAGLGDRRGCDDAAAGHALARGVAVHREGAVSLDRAAKARERAVRAERATVLRNRHL